MVDIKVEATEPDPSASSIVNDNTINNDSTAATDPILGESTDAGDRKATEAAKEIIAEIKAKEKEGDGTDSKEAGESNGTADESISEKEVHGSLKPDQTMTVAPEIKKEINGDAKPYDKTTAPGDGNTGDRRAGNKRGGYQGGRKFEDYRKNVKTDFTAQKESSDPDEIRKQVEFYFSDSNLTMDKFLLEKVGGSLNNPVPISVLHSFKRMRHFQPFSAVLAALKDSTILEVVDEESVRRKVPLDESFTDKPLDEVQKVYEGKAMARSVYVKGFGEETPSTQFDIEAFFTPFGPTNAIRLRRAETKWFKGSVFVEFDSEETQKSFLAMDPQPKWKGKELLIKSKKQYCDDKVDDIKAGRIKRKEHWKPDNRGGDDRDWRVRRDEDRKGGFKDDRGKGGHKGFGSSSRGRGRGRGGRDNNRDRDRETLDKMKKPKDEHVVPGIATSTPESAGEIPPSQTSNKRAREDDDEGDGRSSAKKVDDKPDAPPIKIDMSRCGLDYVTLDSLAKKRARGEDGDDEGQGDAKKVHMKDEGS